VQWMLNLGLFGNQLHLTVWTTRGTEYLSLFITVYLSNQGGCFSSAFSVALCVLCVKAFDPRPKSVQHRGHRESRRKRGTNLKKQSAAKKPFPILYKLLYNAIGGPQCQND
jgi:hypothetical protein